MTETSRNADAQRFIEPLPPKPNLDKQRKLAKTLALDYWRGDAAAMARVQALHPKPPAADTFALADAQLVIARGYGFESWAKLKHKIDSLTKPPVELFGDAVRAGDVEGVRALLRRASRACRAHQRAAVRLQAARDPARHGQPRHARSAHRARRRHQREIGLGDGRLRHPGECDARADAGADRTRRAGSTSGRLRSSTWPTGCAASSTSDPSLVNAKGGDGKRPLHYAASVEIARASARPRRRDRRARRRSSFDAGAVSRQRPARRRSLPARRAARARTCCSRPRSATSTACAGISTRTRARSGCG